jgi:putative transcriptional regulator
MIKCRLKVLLAEKDINQSILAKDINMRLPTINEIANNQAKHIPVSTMDSLCSYFGCTVGDIWQHIPDSPNDKK